MARILIMLILCLPLTGCYYMQAAAGQWEVIRKREPIGEVLVDPQTTPELAARLRILTEARDFSVSHLGLPDNKSYRSYTELERDYVVWNVFAAPEFSLQPKQWCFPVAGCVSYRGYFSRAAAVKKSEQLAAKGYDVAVGGVAAYSTLGKFNDPILSTMMRWDDVALVAVLFHELAHQVVYIKGDSAFNESFATSVEEIGVQRWLESRDEMGKMADYREARDLQQVISGLVADAREALEIVYQSDSDDFDKRALKSEALEKLADQISTFLVANGRENSGWYSGELNNARLISTTLYEGLLPAFRSVYAKCGREMQCFYAEVKRLAAMSATEREVQLAAGDALGLGSNESQLVR